MNEIELLQQFINLSHDKIRIEAQTLTSNHDKTLEKCMEDLEQVKKALISVSNKDASMNSMRKIKDRFKLFINELSKHQNDGIFITRNQGMLLENWLFSSLTLDLKNLVQNISPAFFNPVCILTTNDNEDSVSLNSLIEFLEQEIRILDGIQSVDYVQLLDYYENFEHRIKQRFVLMKMY